MKRREVKKLIKQLKKYHKFTNHAYGKKVIQDCIEMARNDLMYDDLFNNTLLTGE